MVARSSDRTSERRRAKWQFPKHQKPHASTVRCALDPSQSGQGNFPLRKPSALRYFLSNLSTEWPIGVAEASADKHMKKSDTFEPGDVIQAKGTAFRVTHRLGAGGMGEVFLAMDQTLGIPRVLKMPTRFAIATSTTARKRFIMEAKIIVRISHPNVVGCLFVEETVGDDRAHDTTGELVGIPLYVMENLQGASLRAFLAGKRTTVARSVELGTEIFHGLQGIHDCGVIHRDIKADNILLHREAGEVRVKIIDFGLAYPVAEPVDEGAFCGTPLVAAPEQLLVAPLTTKTDVFSAGCVLFEMLTGVRPYEGFGRDYESQVLRYNQEAPLISEYGDFPPALVEMVRSTLHVDPARRMPAGAAVAALTFIMRDIEGFDKGRLITANELLKDPSKGMQLITQAELENATSPDGVDPWWLDEYRNRKSAGSAPAASVIVDGAAAETEPPGDAGATSAVNAHAATRLQDVARRERSKTIRMAAPIRPGTPEFRALETREYRPKAASSPRTDTVSAPPSRTDGRGPGRRPLGYVEKTAPMPPPPSVGHQRASAAPSVVAPAGGARVTIGLALAAFFGVLVVGLLGWAAVHRFGGHR